MARPERKIDRDAKRKIAQYSGLPLTEQRVDTLLQFVQDYLKGLREWESEELGFTFRKNGTFHFVKPAYAYRIPWEVPVPLNKNRPVSHKTKAGE